MIDYTALKAEICKPQYAGMTDAQIAAAINSQTIQATSSPMRLDGGVIYNCIVPSEWAPLTADQKQNIGDVISAASSGIGCQRGSQGPSSPARHLRIRNADQGQPHRCGHDPGIVLADLRRSGAGLE